MALNNRQSPDLSESGSDSDPLIGDDDEKTSQILEHHNNYLQEDIRKKIKRKLSASPKLKLLSNKYKAKSQKTITDWSSALDSINKCSNNTDCRASAESDSDEDVPWEEVDSFEQCKSDDAYPAALQVYINSASKIRKGKNTRNAEDAFNRAIKRARQKVQASMHRVHLLCLLANLLNRSGLCDNALVRAITLSFVPEEFLRNGNTPNDWSVADLACFLAWFRRHYKSISTNRSENYLSVKELAKCAHFHISFGENLVLLFVSSIRAMGGCARLLSSFEVLPWKQLDTDKPTLKSSKNRTAGANNNHYANVKSANQQKVRKCEPPLVKDCDFKFWAEVLLPEEGDRWIPVDCLCGHGNSGAIDDANAIASRCKHPLIILSSEAGGLIADVSARYDPLWGTETRRSFDFNWLQEILNSDWIPRRAAADVAALVESNDLRTRQRAFPLPFKCEDLRGHPLYAMPRYLHKYEVLYPSDSAPLAYLKGEPIYARELVHVCHTRETWFRQARVVMSDAIPMKRVNCSSQKRKLLDMSEDQQTVDIFGYWQTTGYEPLTLSEDGIVPRNEYGNVDLYKASMLPHGCTHLKLPGIGRIARELGVDAAVAITGWEFNAKSRAHPVQDGWVVPTACVPYLTDAWVQKESAKSERLKNQIAERVAVRWERLVRGLFIKARLKTKYGCSNA